MEAVQPKSLASRAHSHLWIVGLAGVIAGVVLLHVPQLEAVGRSVLLFAAFHVIGGVVILASLAYLASIHRPPREEGTGVRFGWGAGWMNGLSIAALVFGALAVATQIAWPGLWPLAFALILLGGTFFVGGVIVQSFRVEGMSVLPFVDLFQSERDTVLDVGCGSGRTTMAIGRVLKAGQIVGLDRFDAGYIEDGGRRLLERNIVLKGLADRVRLQQGDIGQMPFEAATFDSAVSTAVFDHLGGQKQQGLNEVFRVLKPGGRFLMGVWVPSPAVFSVGNVLSFLLSSKADWRRMAKAAGFDIVEEGVCNFSWFVLLQKPGARS